MIVLNTGFLKYNGMVGDAWLPLGGVFSGSTLAAGYHLDFNASNLYSSNGPTNRYVGFPVRCLASGAWFLSYNYKHLP